MQNYTATTPPIGVIGKICVTCTKKVVNSHKNKHTAMPLNRNTLMRMRTIDACLQRRQRRWTIEDLRQACEDALRDYEGIDSVSLRTVQRDIELMRSGKLGYYAPIVVRDRKYYEYSDPGFSITQLPLSEQDLAELSSAIDIIRHYQGFQGMKGQEDILARMQDQLQAQQSHHQVVYIETNKQLKGLQFLGQLYDFIIKREPIAIDYKPFKAHRQSQIYISPYILKEYNNRWFLIGNNQRKRDIQTIALDRIIAVQKDEKGQFRENTFFDAEEYLGSMVGVTRDLRSSTERVVLRIDADQAPYVLTKPLHHSQKLQKTGEDGSITVAIEVIPNLELERLILGYGSHIEVLSPWQLRQHIARQVIIAASKYQPHV